MPIGPGRYDNECSVARHLTGAKGCMLLVFEGADGSGFSCQLSLEIIGSIPAMLRDMANQIESDMKKGQV